MRETAKLRHRYHATAKYYKIMKAMQKEDSVVVMRELKDIRDQMSQIAFDDPKYPQLRQRENIIHQFEPIVTTRTLVGARKRVEKRCI